MVKFHLAIHSHFFLNLAFMHRCKFTFLDIKFKSKKSRVHKIYISTKAKVDVKILHESMSMTMNNGVKLPIFKNHFQQYLKDKSIKYATTLEVCS